MAASAADLASKMPGSADAMRGLAQAEGALTGALGRFFAVAEAYPDLKANQTMMQLMEELTSTENKVSFARQAFNDSVMQYNITRESFPSNILAGMFGFGPAELLQSTESADEKKAPKVSFS
jgi:LemA protein